MLNFFEPCLLFGTREYITNQVSYFFYQNIGRKITLKGGHGKYLSVAENETVDATAHEAGQRETFEVIPRGGNKYAFKSDPNQKYLVAEGLADNYAIKASRDIINSWEEFEVQQETEGIAVYPW